MAVIDQIKTIPIKGIEIVITIFEYDGDRVESWYAGTNATRPTDTRSIIIFRNIIHYARARGWIYSWKLVG